MRIPLHAGTKGASHPCCSRCHRTSNPMRPPASNPRWSFCVTNQKQDRRRRRYHLERNTASITKMKPTTVRTSTGLGKSRERWGGWDLQPRTGGPAGSEWRAHNKPGLEPMLPTVRKWVMQTELAKSTRKSQQAERLDRRKRHTDWRQHRIERAEWRSIF
jgi:hypothetical protein